MPEIQTPNLWASYAQGMQFGAQQKAQRQAAQDQNALRSLAPQIINGDPNAYASAAAIDPKAAQEYQGAGDAQLKRLSGAVDFIEQAQKSGNPQAVEAAYQQVRPYLQKMGGGQVPPATFAEAEPQFQQAKARIAMAKGTQLGNVQSTYIDNQGNRIAIMRDGTTQVLGQNAPSIQVLDAGANGVYGINKTNMQATPINIGGQPQGVPQGQPPSEQPTPPSVDALTAQATQMAANGVPEAQVDAWLQQQLSAPQTVTPQQRAAQPAGNSFQTGTQLVSAPKAPSASDQLAMQAYQARTTRTLTPDETAAAGFRPGTIVQQDGYGNNKVVQAPTADRQAMSETQRKDMLARRAKMPQVQNVTRGIDRIQQALQGLTGSLVDTGPMDAMVQRYTPAGQELEAATGAIQNSMMALTRVPGIGSQSDLEARIANMQYPSLDKSPEVNRRTMENLRAFVADLKAAYDNAAEQDKTLSTAAPEASVPAAEDDDVSDLLSKYGLN